MIRRKYLIDPQFQKFFMYYTLSVALFICALFYAFDKLFFNSFIAQGQKIGLPQNHIFFQFIKSQQDTLELQLAIIALLLFGVLIVLGIYLSHRIAGPIYHLKSYLKDVRNGTAKAELHFRKNDFFHDLADEVNLTLSTQNKKHQKI